MIYFKTTSSGTMASRCSTQTTFGNLTSSDPLELSHNLGDAALDDKPNKAQWDYCAGYLQAYDWYGELPIGT